MEELRVEDLAHVTGGDEGLRRSPSPPRHLQGQNPAGQPNEPNVNPPVQQVNPVQQAIEDLNQAIAQMPRRRRQVRQPRQNIDNLIIRPQ